MVAADFAKVAPVILGVAGVITSSFFFKMIVEDKSFIYSDAEWLQLGWCVYLFVAIFAPLRDNPIFYVYALLFVSFYLFAVDVTLGILRFQLLWTDFVRPFFASFPPTNIPYSSWDFVALMLGLILMVLACGAFLTSMLYAYRYNELSNVNITEPGNSLRDAETRIKMRRIHQYELLNFTTQFFAIAGLLLAIFMILAAATGMDFTDRDLEWMQIGWPVFMLMTVGVWEKQHPRWFLVLFGIVTLYLLIADIYLIQLRAGIFWSDFLVPFFDGFPAPVIQIKNWDLVAYVVDFMIVIAAIIVFMAAIMFLWTFWNGEEAAYSYKRGNFVVTKFKKGE